MDWRVKEESDYENPTPKEDAAVVPDDECFVLGCKSASNLGREKIDHPDITKGQELSVLSLLEDHLPGERPGNLPRQEAHVAFSVPGLGKVEARTPVNSPSCVSLFEVYPSRTKSTEFLLDDFDFGEISEDSMRKRRDDRKRPFERNGILGDGWNGELEQQHVLDCLPGSSRFTLKEGAGADDFSNSWNSRLCDEMKFGEGKLPTYFDGCDTWNSEVVLQRFDMKGIQNGGSKRNVGFFRSNGSEESCSSSSAVRGGGEMSKLAMAQERVGVEGESGKSPPHMFGDRGCHHAMKASASAAFPFPFSAELHIDAKLMFGNFPCVEKQRKVTMRAPMPVHFGPSSFAAFDDHQSQALQAAAAAASSYCKNTETSNIHDVFDLKW